MRRRHWLCAVLAALPLAGCTASHPTAPSSAPPRPALQLVAFDSCEQLLTELRAAAKRSVGPGGLPGNAIPEALAAGDARAMQAAGAAAPPVPAAPHSGTNVHEQGVDEPDIVKTDGRRIVTVADGVLRVVDPVTRAQTGRLDLGRDATGPAQLLLSGDRALVLISGVGYETMDRRLLPPGQGRPEVLLVDLAGPPKLVSRYSGEGRLVDARQTGDVARVVLSTAPKINFPMTATTDSGLLAQNQKAVGAAGVDAWLPQWEVTTGADTTRGRVDCSAVSRPSTFSGAAMLTILTFDLDAPALTDGSPLAVMADGDLVYGTPASLYVANNQGWWFNRFPSRGGVTNETEIFRFALPAGGKPVLTASGSVPGDLVNQYAMSEWDGDLRVATTDGRSSASAVRVLRPENGKLVRVGEVDGLGKGERIYSVRFIGDRGYVVTFRQTDPLYSIDLSDPAHPRVAGELKITGYSAHLQPVGDGRLIGIGQEADTGGVRQGLQVSLFDVSDPADPQRLAQQVVQNAGSAAEFDPHAILWWPATRLLVVPVSDARGNDALALRVGADGLQAAGRIAGPAAGTPVTRALVVGEQLWTLTETGLAASDLSTLDRVAWVPFA